LSKTLFTLYPGKVLYFLGLAMLVGPLYSAETTAADTKLDYLQANHIMRSAAQLILKEHTTYRLLETCAERFPHLAQTANQTKNVWREHHRGITDKSQQIKQFVTHDLAIHNSAFAADNFALQIDQLIYDGVNTAIQELSQKTRKEQHYLCNRMILSVSTGDWNLSNRVKNDYEKVLNYKFNSQSQDRQ
jgi:hypothetical protein